MTFALRDAALLNRLTYRLFLVLTLLVSIGLCRYASADDAPNDPVALKQQGDAAMDKAEFQDALDAYTKAYSIKPSPVLLYNQGRALQALHRMPDALDKLREFKTQAPPDLIAKVPKLDDLIDEVAGHVSTLALVVEKPGATVTLDDHVLGTTPLGALSVNAGKARIQVSLEGYTTQVRDVVLPAKGRLEIRIDLVAKDRSATLVVKSPISGATVSVDGTLIGAVPSEVQVSAGAHTIHVSAPDHDASEVKAVVKAGETKMVDVDLASSSVAKKPWFWVTVIGVPLALGGIAGGTAAGLLESGKRPGTIGATGQLTVQVFAPRIPF